jgi:hypothetical protein
MLLRNEKRYKPEEGPVSIRAVLSRKHYNLLIFGQATLEIPEGVSMQNKSGSKVLHFDCEDRDTAEILCDALDVSGIVWDETV